MSDKSPGIVERIASAENSALVGALLQELRSYDFISAKTIARAMRAAKRRILELKKIQP